MRKLKYGMVGGSKDAFIGEVHRKAIAMTEATELVCGCFSSKPEKSGQTGDMLFLPQNRVYSHFDEMINKESELPEGERMDFLVIATPNFLHFEQAKAALTHGFHVVCDKPMTFNPEEAFLLADIQQQTGREFCLTHAYNGYPMVKQAKAMISDGRLGKIRKVVVAYPQGWLSQPIEQDGQKQASWRTDPQKSGISCTFGDIGVHAMNIVSYMTRLKIEAIAADLGTIVDSRKLDDDGSLFIRYEQKIRGLLTASQVCTGEENELKVNIYGDKAGLEWLQSAPNSLKIMPLDGPVQIYRTGKDNQYLSEPALDACHLPSGHPEGYLEAFSNIYRNFTRKLQSLIFGATFETFQVEFPGIKEGLEGMIFIETAVKATDTPEKWMNFNYHTNRADQSDIKQHF